MDRNAEVRRKRLFKYAGHLKERKVLPETSSRKVTQKVEDR